VPQVYTIDGNDFFTLEEFYAVIGRTLIPVQPWGENLDAFNDILFWPVEGGEPYRLVWRNSDLSRLRLGYPETMRQLEKRLSRCHPANVPLVAKELEMASRGEGPTVFDWLVEIIEGNREFVVLQLA
jgi:RNAse (barnase) inhibitor barstar